MRSRLDCPPLRQRLKRIVRVPVDIRPQRLRKISSPGRMESIKTTLADASGLDERRDESTFFSEASLAAWKPGRIISSGPRRGSGNQSINWLLFLERSAGSGDQP